MTYTNPYLSKKWTSKKFPSSNHLKRFMDFALSDGQSIYDACDQIGLPRTQFHYWGNLAEELGLISGEQRYEKIKKMKIIGGENSGKVRKMSITYFPGIERIGGFDKDYKRLQNYSLS
ncbi:MAG: hypothetical protein KAT37_01490 [Candidatus Aenigmarchaeota archaeon]|nr:hypothetical protein [Candidatus Aenigmarchaeota archaeon]